MTQQNGPGLIVEPGVPTTPVYTDDPRLTNARTPTAHTHVVTDLLTTGSRGVNTFLRGDGAWAVPAGGSGGGADVIGLDTDGVPYFDLGGDVNDPVTIGLDTDGVPYFTPEP